MSFILAGAAAVTAGIAVAKAIKGASDKKKAKKEATLWVASENTKDASKCFTINTTANGISLTGDDKHNAIFLPKIALPELVKALMDFI